MELERTKSDQRRRYEMEVAGIRQRFGDLEDMRERLGLNQRKMAELLFVDPSAWTRWVKGGQAPAHVYRALAWYLELQELERATAVMKDGSLPSATMDSSAPLLSESPSRVKNREPTAHVKGALAQERLRAEFKNEILRLKEHYEGEIEHLRRLNVSAQSASVKTEKITLGWKLFLLMNTAAVLYLILANLF